jgi:flavin reductase (DIM6/NTAB) family NADH-FMN oxidoreductase RutF
LSINTHHSSYRLLKEGRAFSVNVLKKGQLDLAERYGRPARADRLAGTECTTGRLGLPLLREPLARFECISGKLLDSEAEPMSYRQTGEMDGASALFPDVFGD